MCGERHTRSCIVRRLIENRWEDVIPYGGLVALAEELGLPRMTVYLIAYRAGYTVGVHNTHAEREETSHQRKERYG